jgi:antitoxin HicB
MSYTRNCWIATLQCRCLLEVVLAMARFYVYLEPAEEGGSIVSAPALPGCVTQGNTKEEALEMIKDAIRGYIASLRKHGDPLPPGHEAGEFQLVDVEVDASA